MQTDATAATPLSNSESELAAISEQQNAHLRAECADVRAQAEETRRRMNWALAERERIVTERDALRHMCDELRQERDDAITKFAYTIKDVRR